jgi:hypothetical protein
MTSSDFPQHSPENGPDGKHFVNIPHGIRLSKSSNGNTELTISAQNVDPEGMPFIRAGYNKEGQIDSLSYIDAPWTSLAKRKVDRFLKTPITQEDFLKRDIALLNNNNPGLDIKLNNNLLLEIQHADQGLWREMSTNILAYLQWYTEYPNQLPSQEQIAVRRKTISEQHRDAFLLRLLVQSTQADDGKVFPLTDIDFGVLASWYPSNGLSIQKGVDSAESNTFTFLSVRVMLNVIDDFESTHNEIDLSFPPQHPRGTRRVITVGDSGEVTLGGRFHESFPRTGATQLNLYRFASSKTRWINIDPTNLPPLGDDNKGPRFNLNSVDGTQVIEVRTIRASEQGNLEDVVARIPYNIPGELNTDMFDRLVQGIQNNIR